MSKLNIIGGKRLSGEISIHGAKNSALPVLAACLAANDKCEIHNCPALTDVRAAMDILRYLGCSAELQGNTAMVDTTSVTRCDIPERLMREMRSSISFLGAIAARCGKAEISAPGGCELGARPIDMHLDALRRMGGQIDEHHGYIHCRVEGRLRGAPISLGFPSVGATENIMVLAATAEGTTTISNAAREPEISDLAQFLISCGARISGAGDSTITVEGVDSLHGCTHTVIPDRIEAVTYMAAAAVTRGDLNLTNVCLPHLAPVIPIFEEMGCSVACGEDSLRIRSQLRLSAPRYIRTMPYPGFPTDAQAIMMAAACTAKGTSVFVENIFDNRYRHVGELRRLGAKIHTEGRVAVVEGVPTLTGAQVCATDLRGAAALIVAGTAAEGCTTVSDLHHLDRGYQDIEGGLRSVGAQISRV